MAYCCYHPQESALQQPVQSGSFSIILHALGLFKPKMLSVEMEGGRHFSFQVFTASLSLFINKRLSSVLLSVEGLECVHNTQDR